MTNEIGKSIGKVSHRFSTKLDSGEEGTITVNFDLSNCYDKDIISWIVSNRVIAFQRPARALSLSEFEALDGSTICAEDAGKKIISKDKKFQIGISALRAAGMSKEADELERKWKENNS